MKADPHPRIDPARGARRLSRKPALVALGVLALVIAVLLNGTLSRSRRQAEPPETDRTPLPVQGEVEAIVAAIPRGTLEAAPEAAPGPGDPPGLLPAPLPAALPAPVAAAPEPFAPGTPPPGFPPAPVAPPPLPALPIRLSLPPGPGTADPEPGPPPGEALAAHLERREDGDAIHPWRLQEAPARLELKAGTIIGATLMNGIDSDLPGVVLAQVDSPVYDSLSGEHLLVPQGARLLGRYEDRQEYGDVRVGIRWDRLLLPDGSSLSLGGVPGLDARGRAGLRDRVHRHYGRIYGSVILLSAVSAGVALSSQPREVAGTVVNVGGASGLSPQDTASREVALNAGRTLGGQLQRAVDIQPTLIVRPGFRMALILERDVGFERPWPEGPRTVPEEDPPLHDPAGAP